MNLEEGKEYQLTKEPNETVVENWRNILFDERIDEKNAASAFYRQEQGRRKRCLSKS